MNELDEFEDEGTVLDDFISPFDGTHSSHKEHRMEATEDVRRVTGHSPAAEKRIRQRREVIVMLGDECTNCGATKLLHIHHTQGDGVQERARLPNHNSRMMFVHREVKKGTERYALLCVECHTEHHRLEKEATK